jgi:hypothetical protein
MIAVKMADKDVINFTEAYPVLPELHLCPLSAIN